MFFPRHDFLSAHFDTPFADRSPAIVDLGLPEYKFTAILRTDKDTVTAVPVNPDDIDIDSEGIDLISPMYNNFTLHTLVSVTLLPR